MQFKRFKILAKIELLKLTTRLNTIYFICFFALVFLEVSVIIKMQVVIDSNKYLPAGRVYQAADKYINNIAFTILPLLFIINLSREFEKFIVHRFLFSGMNRKNYFLAKLFQLFFFSLIAFILAIIFDFAISIIYYVPLSLRWLLALNYFVVTFYLGGLCMGIVFFLKKTFYSILFFVAYVLVENIVHTFLTNRGVDILLPYSVAIKILRHADYSAINYLLLVIFLVLFSWLSFLKFKKTDLK